MSSSYYETDRALSEYLLFHFGTAEQLLPYEFGPAQALGFPARCVSECLLPAQLSASGRRALDLGCAVGRSSFELARHCAEVIGMDYSPRLIAAARHLQKDGRLDFSYIEEGDLAIPAIAFVPEEIDRGKVTFVQGDAEEPPSGLAGFDVVLMANLIDRLRTPRRCLQRLPQLVKPGGQLILASPYTWLIEFTPRENWLGGFERKGQRVKTLDTLEETLSPHFDLAARTDLPFLIREHARKFQWSVAEATTWIRNQNE